MAYRENLSAVVARLQLNNGTTTTGGVRTQNISIGALNYAAWDVEKFGAISEAVSAALIKPVHNLQSVKTYDIYQ